MAESGPLATNQTQRAPCRGPLGLIASRGEINTEYMTERILTTSRLLPEH